MLGILLALGLPRSSQASSIYCGLQMLSPNCTPVASDNRWPPDAQPTFGLGCVGYPSPPPMTDAGDRPTPLIDYFLPTMATVKLVIEAGGQTLNGGSFSDTGITCTDSCKLDAGMSRNCSTSGLVRYTGPLLPGQEHKIIWTNSMSSGSTPYLLFKVTGSPAVDAGLATATNTSIATSNTSTATSTTTSTGTLATSTSTAVGITPDADTPATATGTSSSAFTTDPGITSVTTDTSTSTSTAIDTNPSRDAGVVRAKTSSSCSCSLAAPKRFPPVSLAILSSLGLALALGRRPRRPR
jgi:hypothetical protein